MKQFPDTSLFKSSNIISESFTLVPKNVGFRTYPHDSSSDYFSIIKRITLQSRFSYYDYSESKIHFLIAIYYLMCWYEEDNLCIQFEGVNSTYESTFGINPKFTYKFNSVEEMKKKIQSRDWKNFIIHMLFSLSLYEYSVDEDKRLRALLDSLIEVLLTKSASLHLDSIKREYVNKCGL